MRELDFLGRGADSETLVFSDADGNRFSVAITEELRSSVRLLGTSIAAKPSSAHLSPGEIQNLLRQGFSVEEIASTYSLEPEKIRRYEGPVQDEKLWVVRKTLSRPVAPGVNAPTLEDLVVNRLTARGVDPGTLSWTASKRPGQSWEIHLTFVLGTLKREAHWKVMDGKRVQALDQESAWLTSLSATGVPMNTALNPTTMSNLSLTQTNLSAEEIKREALIDKLNAQRGRPQPLLEEFEGEIGQDNVTTLSMFGLHDGIEDIPEDSSVTGFLNRPDEHYGAWEPQVVEPITQNDVFAGIDEAVSLTPLPKDSDLEHGQKSPAVSINTHQNSSSEQSDEPAALTASFLFGKRPSKTGVPTNQDKPGNQANAGHTPQINAPHTGSIKIGGYGHKSGADTGSNRPAEANRRGPDSSIFSVVNGGANIGSTPPPVSGAIPTIPAAQNRNSAPKGTVQRKSVIQSTDSNVADRIAATGSIKSLSGMNTTHTGHNPVVTKTPVSVRKSSKTGGLSPDENLKSERKSSSKRKPMPSWDEIVFGAKHE